MKLIKGFWAFVVWVFEKSDIIPPLIIVSTFHYAGALKGKDPWFVAFILGALIDLGHYRTVKAFLKHLDFWRGVIMVVFTLMTGYFHWLWYRDVLLAISLPMLIIGLALLSKWEQWDKQGEIKIKVTTPKQTAINAPEETRNLPAPSADWRRLTAEERRAVATMTTAEIVAAYHVSERTARDWRHKKQEAER